MSKKSSSTESEERLSFSGSIPYANSEMAEHFNRYASVREICQGKRVLDFSCGEGYGSELIRRWGASHVVGVDISESAIESASNKYGANQGIEFLNASAETILDVLDNRVFDLIVSIETIEHVPNPIGMLNAIKALLAPNGVAVITCPNDYAFAGIENPYHLKKYKFGEFQALCQSVLGENVVWRIGSPVAGHAIYPIETPTEGLIRGDVLQTKLDEFADIFYSPSQPNTIANQDNCSFYIGVWGAESLRNTVTVWPSSLWAQVEPWANIDYFKEQLRTLEAELQSQKDQVASYRRVIESNMISLQKNGGILVNMEFTSKWGRRRKKWMNSIRKRLK